MIALVTGGAASGKSAFAESLALTLPGPHVYLATMRHGDGETESRIERHRAARAGKGFATVELFGGNPASLPAAATVLVEDLGNLVLNTGQDCRLTVGTLTERPHPQGACASAHQSGLQRAGCAGGRSVSVPTVNLCSSSARNVVYVGNEIGCDGVRYDGFTRDFIERLGALSCEIAATADLVVEVAAGIPCVVKGELPCRC